jgi:predicted ATPase
VRDHWDDFGFKTLHVLHYTDKDGERSELGAVKVGEFAMDEDGGSVDLERSFRRLSKSQFSVGQDREYYELLLKLPDGLGPRVLESLNDIALDEELFERAILEPVTTTSLFRTIDSRTVEDQFRRIARGGVPLTRYHVKYLYPGSDLGPSPILHFEVDPRSKPPTNVHVLIGSNGAGKTFLLNNMANALARPSPSSGSFIDAIPPSTGIPFVNLVTVTFSAFDPFHPTDDSSSALSGINYSYVGLKSGSKRETVKTAEDLAKDFVASMRVCSRGPRRERWTQTVEALRADRILSDSRVLDLFDPGDTMFDSALASDLFSSLSSGHKIVMLTITRLVETVEEKSLVLIDEPEAHLHPPLLSALTRAVSDLLEERNGVAIIATHSPVVLQEVPSTCVTVIGRVGGFATAEPLEIESFGEGVGTLTASVFGLEVTETGFHQLLVRALTKNAGSYEGAVAYFGSQLGGEARAILRSLSDRTKP